MPSNETDLASILREFVVCREGMEWATGRTVDEALRDCRRADWILWIAGRMAGRPGWPGVAEIVRLSWDCAKTALRFIPTRVDAPIKVLRVARAFVQDASLIEDLAAAADQCYRVGYAYFCDDEMAAAWACFACFAVARTAIDTTWAYEVARAAADAYAVAAGENPEDEGPAKLRSLSAMADLIRNRLRNLHGLSTLPIGLPFVPPRNRVPRWPTR